MISAASIRFDATITLGEIISIALIIAVPAALWGWKASTRWLRNHAYTLEMYSGQKLAEIVKQPKALGDVTDPDPYAPMTRHLKVETGENHLYVRLRCHRNRQILERWFWFEDRSRRMLHMDVADIERVNDMDIPASFHLYDPKPPEIELGEPQGVAYPTGIPERRHETYDFYLLTQIRSPVDGFLTIKCVDSGGEAMFARARVTAR